MSGTRASALGPGAGNPATFRGFHGDVLPSGKQPHNELEATWIPSGKQPHSYGKSPFFMGKSTISMAIFNSKLLNYQRVQLPTFGFVSKWGYPKATVA